MLVSLAVLAVSLSVVGVVFSITTRTVTQAAAISEVHALVRQLMIQLEQDLRFVEPTQSVLIIHGRTQRAALTRDDLDARLNYRVLIGNPNDPEAQPPYDPKRDGNLDPKGQWSNPRADILGFFTMRQVTSQAPPLDPNNNPYLLGAKFGPVHVVYGHAAIAEPVSDPNGPGRWNFGPITHITPAGDKRQTTLSEIPCSQWQLARRALIVLQQNSSPRPRGGSFTGFSDQFGAGFDRFRRCFTIDSDKGGDIAKLDLLRHLAGFGGFSILRPYIDERSPGLWGGGLNLAHETLYGARGGADVENRHVATVIPEPPAELRSNLGVHMLPGCAWFQVEFLMPEDPRNSIDYYDPLPPNNPGRNRRDDMPQWVQVPQRQTYIFVPDTAENRERIATVRRSDGTLRSDDFASMDRINDPNDPNGLTTKRIRTWPYAIRVTVKVFDTRGRLSEPIERTLVHRFE